MDEEPSEKQPHIPEAEKLTAGEIDLTGVVEQEDALRDVIYDAIIEVETDGGTIPDWGARTLARALANRRPDRHSGALHHFAVTGRVDPKAMTRELAELYLAADDDEIREWINWLGIYITRLPG